MITRIETYRLRPALWIAWVEAHPQPSGGANSAVLAAKRLVTELPRLDPATLQVETQNPVGGFFSFTVSRGQTEVGETPQRSLEICPSDLKGN